MSNCRNIYHPMSNPLLKCTHKLNWKPYPSRTQSWTRRVSGPMPAMPNTPGSLPLSISPPTSWWGAPAPHLSALRPGARKEPHRGSSRWRPPWRNERPWRRRRILWDRRIWWWDLVATRDGRGGVGGAGSGAGGGGASGGAGDGRSGAGRALIDWGSGSWAVPPYFKLFRFGSFLIFKKKEIPVSGHIGS